MRELTCAESLDLEAEVALGVADAEDRAAVLLHVEQCAACATSLRSLTEVTDGLVALVPPVPPPAGFEARVLASIAKPTEAPARPTLLERARTRPIAVAAAVALAALLTLGGWLVGETTSAPSASVVTAALVSARATVGQVVVLSGAHPWISMRVHVPANNALVWCEVQRDDGTLETLGTFTIVGGYGYWVSSLPNGTAVRAARLVMADGRVLATATIGTG